MHRKPVVVALIALLALILTGCQMDYYQQLPYQQLLDKPVVEFKEREQKFISFFEAEPIFRFKVDNPNPLGMTVKDMTFNLTILDQKFITGVSDQDVHIRPASSKTIELTLPFNFMDVFDTADEFQTTPYARFDLAGEVSIGAFVVPYDISGEFDIPRVPSITVETINVDSLSPDHARLRMTIVLNNSSPFPIPSGYLEYSTTLGGVMLGEERPVPIPAVGAGNKKRTIIPIEVTAPQMDGPMGEILKKPTAVCVLSGSIIYAVPGRGRRNFPFMESNMVPLAR